VRLRFRVGVFLLAALCVGGCSGGGGHGWVARGVTATPTPAVETTSERPAGGAPSVDEPLDVEVLRRDPCGAVTAEQLSGLGITDAGLQDSDEGNPECRWHLSDSELHVIALSPVVSGDGGLGDVYEKKDYQQYFEPTEVDGYPAVFASVLDQRSQGNCDLWIGVTDQLAVSVETYFLEVDPCPVAERIATAMIEHARG
jgi:uncharacterized protein DUF3558